MAARKGHKSKSGSKDKVKSPVADEEPSTHKRRGLRYWIFYAIIGGLIIGLLSYARGGIDPDRIEHRIEQRLAEGKRVPLKYHILLQLPRAARSNAILLAGCALIGLVALRRIRRPGLVDPPHPALAGKLNRMTPIAPMAMAGIAGIAGAVMLWSGLMNAPRLSTSLWGDEEYTMRRFVVGEFEKSDDGTRLKYVPRTWREAFFDMHNTNNHVLNTLLAKLSHEAFTRPPSPEDDGLYFSESALRWPGYAAGLGAIAALTWCLWTLGLRRAAIIAPFLLALHPWYVRYATELRGYVYVLLFAPLALGLLWNAARRGHWGWWALYGISQIGLFYAYLGSLHLLIALNLAGILWIWFQHPTAHGQRWTLTARFALTNLLAAIVLWQLYAPCLPQLQTYMGADRFKGAITAEWLVDGIASLFTGMRWQPFSADNPLALSWQGQLRGQGLPAMGPGWGLGLCTLALIVAMLGFGVWALARRGAASRILLIPLLLPGPLFIAQAAMSGDNLYLWYLVIGLPGAVAILAIGMAEAGRLARNPIAAMVIPIAFLALFGASTQAQRSNYRNQPIEPLRESVSLYRQNLNPLAPENREIISLEVFMHPRGYDPAAIRVNSITDFEREIDAARGEGRALYVNLSLLELARLRIPEIMHVLENPDQFDALGIIHGQDEPCTRHVFRMRR